MAQLTRTRPRISTHARAREGRQAPANAPIQRRLARPLRHERPTCIADVGRRRSRGRRPPCSAGAVLLGTLVKKLHSTCEIARSCSPSLSGWSAYQGNPGVVSCRNAGPQQWYSRLKLALDVGLDGPPRPAKAPSRSHPPPNYSASEGLRKARHLGGARG